MDRKTREEYKNWKKGYYHMSLERLEGRLLFNSPEAYRMGMNSVALAQLKFDVEVYAIELMPNHLHQILSGTGQECLKVFAFLRRRLSDQLVREGFPPLPENYGFKLTPIEDRDALRKQILYTVRNPYEKVTNLSKRALYELVGSREELPPEWEIHPELGILPRCYVRTEKVTQLFSSAKGYLTCLVKEYEAMVKIAKALGEEVEFSAEEV